MFHLSLLGMTEVDVWFVFLFSVSTVFVLIELTLTRLLLGSWAVGIKVVEIIKEEVCV
jgi:hypothetical protein